MGKKSIKKNYFYYMIYQVLTLILPFITAPYLSRVLGAEKIGIYGYTYAIVTYFILFGSLGLSLYGQREIAYAQDDVKQRKKVFVELILLRFITIFVASIIYFLFFVNNNNEYNIYYKILFIELLAAAFDISWFFQGIEEFKRTVTRNILVRICSITLVFIFVKTPEDLGKFTLIYSLADLIGNLSLWLYLPKYLAGAKIKNINVFRHFLPIIMLFIPQIANQVYKILDTTMIGKIISDKSETGFYEQSQKVIRLMLTIVTSLGTVMLPRMANTFATGNQNRIKAYIYTSFRFVFFISFPIMFGIIIVAKYFVPIYFGDGYERTIEIIEIMSPIIVLMGITNVTGTQYLLPTKRQKEYTDSVLAGILANFILNYILIKKYAAIGAAIATVISQLVVDIIQLWRIRKDIDLKRAFKASKNYILSSLIMFCICLINEKIIGDLGLKGLYLKNSVIMIVQALLGVDVYLITLLLIKDRYVIAYTEKMKRKLKEKISRKNVEA